MQLQLTEMLKFNSWNIEEKVKRSLYNVLTTNLLSRETTVKNWQNVTRFVGLYYINRWKL